RGLERLLTGAGRVEPVVVVRERSVAVVAAVRLHQRRVIELDAAVDVRHDDPLAAGLHLLPDVVGVDVGDAPLHAVAGGRSGVSVGLGRVGFFVALRSPDLGDGGQVGDLFGQPDRAGVDEDRVVDPERLVLDT